MKPPKRFTERARTSLRRYQKILASAKARDVNESDTAVIVSDMLTDILGYDKYQEVTTEFAIRSTYCDLAIRVGGRLQYLIEVKSIDTELRETHLRQAIDYGSRQGVEWVLLTTGAVWEAHRIRFEQPVTHDLVFRLDLLDPTLKPAEIIEKLYLVSKEACDNSAIDHYWERKEATSRYVIAQLLLDGSTLRVLRRRIRTLFPGVKITEAELEKLLRAEVLKRDALEGERALIAEKSMRRAHRRHQRARESAQAAVEEAAPTPQA
jgi:predicted type IV restriction endonuclease